MPPMRLFKPCVAASNCPKCGSLAGRTRRLMYINNDGGGFADHIEVEAGTTVAEIFERKMPDRDSEDFLIRVNRQPASAGQVLQENDRVSNSPTKLAGAG